jgi:hypothetical protein
MVLGGLGVFDIRRLSWVLRARWPWLQMTEPEKPWAQIQLHICKEVQSLISMATVTTIGDGSNTLFWKDWWLNGKSIIDTAPAILAMIPTIIVNKRMVNEAFPNMRWLSDFQGASTFQVLLEYFDLYQVLDQVMLQPGCLMCTCGGSQLQDGSPQNQPTQPCFKEQLRLSRRRESGELGPLISADFSFCWFSANSVGLPISWLSEAWSIQSDVSCVINKMRQLVTC